MGEIKITQAMPTEMTLEELAMDYDRKYQPDGGVKVVKYVNQKKLRAEIQKLNAKGLEVMRPFMEWCMEEYGIKETTLKKPSLAVWRMIHENPQDPILPLLDKDKHSFIERRTLRKYLTRFAAWMIETAENPEHVEYAKRLTNRIQDIPHNKKLRDPKRKLKKATVQPLTDEEMEALFSALDRYAIKRRARCPWMKPVMRFVMLTGQIAPYDFTRLEYEDLAEQLAKHERGEPAAVSLWNAKARARRVPVGMAYEELKMLADWPYPWGVMTDILCPASSHPDRQGGTALRENFKTIVKEAGIPWERSMAKRVRAYVIKKIWDTSHDYLLLDSMFAMPMAQVKNLDYLEIPLPIHED